MNRRAAILGFLFGCSIYNPKIIIDPRLQGYYLEFEMMALERGVRINKYDSPWKIHVSDIAPLEGNTDQTNLIVTIDPRVMRMANDNYIKWVVFHELCHAFLQANHEDPVIFMSSSCLACHWPETSSPWEFGMDQAVENYLSKF